jgi:predicted Rdx family selenoprotein
MDETSQALLPDRQVAQRYGVTVKAIKGWDRKPDLGFPPAIPINGRRYRKVADLIAWERQRAKPENRRQHLTKWRKAHGRIEAAE